MPNLNFNFAKSPQKRVRLGLVYDVPSPLESNQFIKFPEDATAEWETENTIQFIINSWRELDFEVILFPIDAHFLKNWSELARSCDLIHSLVEGWGSPAREGWIPSLCELSGIPCIGSTPLAHAISMRKSFVKTLCQSLEIPTAPFYAIRSREEFAQIPSSFFKETHFIKPDCEGSSMGIDAHFSISDDFKRTKQAVENLLEKHPEGILIEKYLEGTEYTCAIIGSPETAFPIARIDIETEKKVYDAKIKTKSEMLEKVTFPRLPAHIRETILTGTGKIFTHLSMHDMARMDWKCDAQGQVFFLEANTLPGLSYYYSVLPLIAKEAGLSYQDMLATFAQSALKRKDERPLWYGKTRLHEKAASEN